MGFFSSSIGKKYIMGIAGLIWTGFVAGHMAGNLFIFAGAETFNKYGHAIVSNKALLYGTEIVLLSALFVHVFLAINLTLANKKAKPSKYAMGANEEKRSTLASRTMAVHGSVILAFIIYHLITFKYGPHYWIEYDGEKMRDLHRLVIEVFANPAYVFGYVICLILLGIHLRHGAWSVFQSFGINHPRYTPLLKCFAVGYAVVVAGGFISQPLYVYFFQ